ncbi:MAG: hypothetical protein HFJ49_01145 [Clostridia bacterium]|nr:hypothetical protein [Clostridia bacterium]
MNKEAISILQDRYRLTEEEYSEYYKTVNMFFTTGKKREDRPKLIFVAGQAGAGKSRVIPIIKRELEYNVAISDYDIVRSLHPKYEEANKEVAENIHLALLPDADRANKDLRQYCMRNHLNLIYEGTMRGTNVFIEIAKEFQEAGYEIGLRLMAVPKLESYGSTFLRYATDLLHNNRPRWISKEIHDESYEKFIITLRELEKQNLFKEAKVYKRGKKDNGKPIQIYSTEGREYTGPIEAILYGREEYRKEAVKDYEIKHNFVCDILSERAPNLLAKLNEWEELYENEKRELNDREEDRS